MLGLYRRIHKSRQRMQKLPRKCRNRRHLSDPHGDLTGAPPVWHRDHTVWTRGAGGRRKVEGSMKNAKTRRSSRPHKCRKISGLRDPEGRASGALPGPSGGGELPVRALLRLREAPSGGDVVGVAGKPGPITKLAPILLYRHIQHLHYSTLYLRLCRAGLICGCQRGAS